MGGRSGIRRDPTTSGGMQVVVGSIRRRVAHSPAVVQRLL